jgi:hypothetical protein
MSLVDRHATGMLSSVMRALTHMEAHALRGRRPSWQSSAAASAGRFRTGIKPEHAAIGGLRVTGALGTRVVRTTIAGHSTQSRSRSIRGRWMPGTAPLHVSTAHPFSPAEQEALKAYRLAVQAGFYSDWR